MTRERSIQIALGGALLALVAWSTWQRYAMLAASPFPLGVDGYYYAIQVRGLLETGSLVYPSSPLTFWFMLPLAALTDPITGAKLGAALGGALVALPAYGVGAMLGTHRGAGLLAAALATTSATSAYLTTEFVKQGVGLTVALAAVWLVLRALAVPSRARLALALGGVVTAALAHKLAAALVLALALPAALEEARGRGALRGRRLLALLCALGLLGVAVVIAGVVAPDRFVAPSDLALLGEVLTSDARWDAPALVRPRLELSFGHEAALAGVLGIAAAVVVSRRIGGPRSLGERVIAWGFVALALVVACPWLDVTDPQGLGFRLRVAAFVPLAICAALVASALVRWVFSARDRDPDTGRTRWWRDGVLATLALVIVLARGGTERTEGRIVPHPALVSAVMAATTHIPEGTTVIVPERHILYMVTWYTRADARLRPEGVPYAERMRLLPLAFTQLGSPLEEALDRARADERVADPPIALHARHPNGLVLVREATWDWLLAAIPPHARAYWGRWPTI